MSSLNLKYFIKQIEEKSMDSLEQIYDNYNIAQEKKQFIENNKFSKESILTLLLENLIVKINFKESLKIKNPDFIWVNLSQIKKLNFRKGILNPFVKTILFMI